jgi:hypothetical protein
MTMSKTNDTPNFSHGKFEDHEDHDMLEDTELNAVSGGKNCCQGTHYSHVSL